ncbi:MAG TPA: LPS assembly lipoprotein LptE [Gemmataceae bacterium]|nr:LPS assembly lipoprotein LptE [Gemmataceae bacterium]
MMRKPPEARRIVLSLMGCCAALLLPSCAWDGNFTILGYTTKPNYDTSIHTVRVPIFKNQTFYRGLEFELTQAVVREIDAKTPYKVVSASCDADTELTGNIVQFTKIILNRNQLNEVREAETIMGVEIVWRNLRTGEILSLPKKGPGAPPPVPADLPPGVPPLKPPPVLVQSVGHFIPEVGGSITTAQKENVDRLAVQVVSMMEVPW